MSVFTFSDLAFMGAAAGAGIALDPDAAAYIARVEGASGDNQALEDGVKTAINDFVIGCKADGIWNAIKASCILAGARTLAGALVPLVGTAPTRFGTEGGWNYNRKTGLRGNGTDNYLNSNRNNNADPQNNRHLCCFATSRNTETAVRSYIRVTFAAGAGASQLLSGASASKLSARLSDDTTRTTTGNLHGSNGFFGISRNSSANYTARGSSINETITQSSLAPGSGNYFVFAGNSVAASVIDLYSDARLAFYSIGEALDLALLDARVTALINAFAASIP